MTKAGEEIIRRLREKGKFTLRGDREYYEMIELKFDKFILVGGETHGNQELYRNEISASDALKKIRTYFEYHAMVFEKQTKLKSDADCLEYWNRWPYEG